MITVLMQQFRHGGAVIGVAGYQPDVEQLGSVIHYEVQLKAKNHRSSKRVLPD